MFLPSRLFLSFAALGFGGLCNGVSLPIAPSHPSTPRQIFQLQTVSMDSTPVINYVNIRPLDQHNGLVSVSESKDATTFQLENGFIQMSHRDTRYNMLIHEDELAVDDQGTTRPLEFVELPQGTPGWAFLSTSYTSDQPGSPPLPEKQLYNTNNTFPVIDWQVCTLPAANATGSTSTSVLWIANSHPPGYSCGYVRLFQSYVLDTSEGAADS